MMKRPGTPGSRLLILILPLLLLSCRKHELYLIPAPQKARVVVSFENFDGAGPLQTDALIYATSLGNRYQVNDLQYFISELVFHAPGGKDLMVPDDDSIHYIDLHIDSTLEWKINGLQLPAGQYDSVSFIFGLDQKANRSNRFPNPPERDMFWPDILGGGYHYMKMNLKWKNDTMTELMPFMFHLGIGQIYEGTTEDPDSIIGFVQNYFRVTLPASSFLLKEGTDCHLTIRMNVDRWFDGENAFDFGAYPMGIMQNEQGMHLACLNGRKVFTCKVELPQSGK